MGTRTYFGEQFVSIAPFEEETYEFFSKSLDYPLLGMTAHDFCKKIDRVYTQEINALRELARIIDASNEFKDVSMEDKPSAIGLSQVLTYTHTKTNIRTEFDGVVFVSEKQISDRSFSIEEAKIFVKKRGVVLEDIAQTGTSNTKMWDLLAMHSAAHCNWRYVTSKAIFDKDKFKGIDINRLILSINFIDPSIVRIFLPTQEGYRGERFSFIVGNKENIRQVLAHESETYRYLHFLESRLRIMRDDILNRRKNLLTTTAPLAPWALLHPWKTVNHWTSLHRSLESVIRHKAYLSSFQQVFQAYKDFEEKGIAFYNLPSPITAKLSQYETEAPRPIEINSSGIQIKDYDKSSCPYAGYPDRLLKFHDSTKELADDTFKLLQSVTTTSGVQASMVLLVISFTALVVSILFLLLSIRSLING